MVKQKNMVFIRGFFAGKIKDKKGQNTVEFMLLMGSIVSLVLSVFALFHEKLAGMFFYIVGAVLG